MELLAPVAAVQGIRKARTQDAPAIARLIRPFAAEGLMLPRTEEEIRRGIQGYRLAMGPGGELAGCIGIRPLRKDLAEIIGFAVASGWQGRGVGTHLLERAVEESLLRGFYRTFAMTLRPGPFLRLGFLEVPRSRIPEKIALDCTTCPFREECRERTLLLDVTS